MRLEKPRSFCLHPKAYTSFFPVQQSTGNRCGTSICGSLFVFTYATEHSCVWLCFPPNENTIWFLFCLLSNSIHIRVSFCKWNKFSIKHLFMGIVNVGFVKVACECRRKSQWVEWHDIPCKIFPRDRSRLVVPMWFWVCPIPAFLTPQMIHFLRAFLLSSLLCLRVYSPFWRWVLLQVPCFGEKLSILSP